MNSGNKGLTMTSLNYGRIYQRYNHYFRQILFIIYKIHYKNFSTAYFFETQGRKYDRNLS